MRSAPRKISLVQAHSARQDSFRATSPLHKVKPEHVCMLFPLFPFSIGFLLRLLRLLSMRGNIDLLQALRQRARESVSGGSSPAQGHTNFTSFCKVFFWLSLRCTLGTCTYNITTGGLIPSIPTVQQFYVATAPWPRLGLDSIRDLELEPMRLS